MVRVYVPGLSELALRVAVTTNACVWHRGIVNLDTQNIETEEGEVISRAQVRWVRHNGTGTWVNPGEARAVVLLLSMIGGVSHARLLEMAKYGTEPELDGRLVEDPGTVLVGE